LPSNVTTVAEFGLGIQAWSGERDPSPEQFAFRPWIGAPRDKPITLFTSTWDPQRQSMSWLDRLRSNLLEGQVTRAVRPDEKLWLLEPDPNATLFIIDSFDDYRRLTEQYEYRWRGKDAGPNYLRGPDWPLIAETRPFDGVHFTGNARQPAEGRLASDPVPLVSWDVESTAWFTFSLTVLECIGSIADDWTVNFEPRSSG
jgi:hypothetical protein